MISNNQPLTQNWLQADKVTGYEKTEAEQCMHAVDGQQLATA